MVKVFTAFLLMMAIILPDPQGLRYYRNEHDFLVGVELPKRKLGWRSYIEVHYDELGRVSQKLYFKRKGKIKQYQVMQYDSITAELSSRILLNEDSVVTSIFTFGSHQEKINKFLSYRAQMDSIQDEGDRFIETIFSKDALPEEYRLYDVNGSHFGTISLAYDDGGLLKQEDWITFPEEDVIRRFLFNNFPETGSIQILEYDSTLGQTHELWVLADGTTALISVDFPHSHSSVSSPHISYHLKEKLVEGWVTWEWLSGTVDSAAPYTAMLIPGEMMEGYHEETVLAYTPELKEGGVYKITFAGSGVSGYPAINVVIDSVTYDTTDPKIFVWCDSVINSPEVYLWASEPLLQMELLWYRWNEQDSLVQRAGNIIGKGLLSLTDDTVLFTVPALLEDGERYSLRTTAWDLAGNRGIGDTLTGIRYDITPPQFYYTTPKSGDFFNRSGVSYELSERAASGVLTWKWIAGVQDSIGLYTIPLSTSQLRQGWHEGVPEMGPPPLVEGAVYEVTLWAEDFAGNTSDKIGIAAVTYDTTAPIVEIMLPRTADAVKSAAVTYLTNETLSSAEINWSEVVFDTITITFQTESLSGDELSAGLHEYPGLPKGGRLRDGNTYRLSLSASDLAGNIAKPFIVEDVNFDTTGPFLADLEPHGGEFVQDERVSFYVDENLAQGVLTWRQIAGEYDPDSPHQISLEDEELKAGEHIDLFPMRGVYLHDGSIYELTFIAADRAGNSSNILVSDSIHFDNTPPQMVIFSPVEDNPIKSSEVVFTLSELLQELTMKWLWREGSLDTSAPHLLQLDKQYLQPGEHHFKDTESLLQLTEGASYDIVLHGRDKAGNEGSSAIITHLTYDIKAPEIIWSYPGDNEYITGVEVTYDLSETLKEGEIIWVWTGGEEDPDAPHKITLSTAERASGLHKNLVLKQAPLLVDGAMYHIRMRGSDAAGNQADPVAVTNVTLDISPPEIVVITPQPFSAVSTTSLYYTLSEDLARGTISWTWRRGSVDPKKVHHRSLQGEALGSGEHAELLFSPPVPLVDGALYTIELTGIDYAGNEASVMPISDVYYDATPPVITEASPFSNSYVNHTEVSYTFSENIQEGTITWHHKGGALDELAPHVVHLTGDELNSGHHSDLSLQEAPLLNDGSIYSIIFAVSDAAGNEAENIVLENIHYDISDPVVTILSPLSQSWIAAPTVGYELSENLARARFVWEWIGGSTDPSAPYFVDLIDDELTVGSHQEVMLAHSPQLVEGAIYDLSLEGEDFAGNPSPIATISALGFDATNPVISNVFPSSYSHINHPEVSYFLSENLAEGRMTWIEKGVTDEELSRQEIVLADRDREIGDHLGVSLNEKLVLKDGSHYDIYLEGEDAAGNRAEPVEIKDITYDITPPEMVLNFPEPGAYIRSGEIAYSSSELLSSAQVLWTQTGGVTESTSPYLVELVGEELKSGEHPLFLPDNTPDFSDGAVFSVKLVGTDLAGNYSSAVEIFEVHLDIDPPMIAGFAPESNSYVNHSRIRYELSENIAVGQIVWEQTGGVNDPATPHIVELVGEELRVGVHPGRELSAQSELVNGSIYSLIFTAVDSAGNAAESVEVNGIQYDIIPPEIVVTQPRIGDYLQSPHLLYELSETCAFAKAVWKWTGGTEDSLLTHTQEMTGEELIEGEHDESLDDKVQLIDGAEYQLTITLQDLAGNDGIPVNITDLYYDSTPPEISIIAPSNDAVVNHTRVSYRLSEDLQSATFEWQYTGGNADESAPYQVELSDLELSAGVHRDIQLRGAPILHDGTTYRLIFSGFDRAKNAADTIRVEALQYDVTSPELSIKKPVANNPINSSIMSYSLSEPLQSGKVIWKQLIEEGEPQIIEVPLIQDELAAGSHEDVTLARAPRLINDTVYDLTIFGSDLAGNPTDTVVITGLTFDNIPPRIEISDPQANTFRNSNYISYRLSENLLKGSISWSRTDGVEDNNSPHLINLIGEELISGDHLKTTFIEEADLQDGSVYTLEFRAEDAAGNIAAPTIISGVSYDVTPPQIDITSPTNISATNSPLISYKLSESLKSAQISWIWISGEPDPTSPHKQTLRGEELTWGEHSRIGREGILISGAQYRLQLMGIDQAGNEGEKAVVEQVLFDNIAPQISVAVPIAGTILSTPRVSYNLSEDLIKGIFRWEQKSGTNDPLAPHVVLLEGSELKRGQHDNVILQNTPSLVEGAIYDLTVTGSDAANNKAEDLLIPVIGFDSQPPVIVIHYPSAGTRLNEWTFDYYLSEDLLIGKVNWVRVGGTEDPAEPHEALLAQQERKAGDHLAIVLAATPQLINGAEYTIKFTGRDRARNLAEPVIIENVSYDITPPAIVASRPAPMTIINNDTVSFSLSEELISGSIVWTPDAIPAGFQTSFTFTLEDNLLQEGIHENISTAVLPNLQSGVTYSLSFEGMDLAGNRASGTIAENITFDNTSPVLTILSPSLGSSINELKISYSLSEQLSSATLMIEQAGGVADPKAPYQYTLTNGLLSAGEHLDFNPVPSPDLVQGAKYQLSLNGTDLGRNSALSDVISDISYDTIPPVIAVSRPSGGEFVNSFVINYFLSEPLAKGRIILEREGGTFDPNSPHKINLSEQGKTEGEHRNIALENQANLIDGSIYSLIITGEDEASNQSQSQAVTNLTYDLSKPSLTQIFPTPFSFINNAIISFTTSEPLDFMEIIWEQTGGEADPRSPYIIDLSSEFLTVGRHEEVKLWDQVPLKSGAIYRLKLKAVDLAGNESETVQLKDITYDIDPPELTLISPEATSFVNNTLISYYLSENLSSASLTWESSTGSEIIVDLTSGELSAGNHEFVELLNAPNLTNGDIYNLTFKGVDKAGNLGEQVVNNEITYDVTPPTIGITAPEPHSIIKERGISFRFSEDLSQAEVVWSREAGVTDSNSPHRLTIQIDELQSGDHDNVVIPGTELIQVGTIYSVSIEGRDLAGNSARSATVQGLDVIRDLVGEWLYKGALLTAVWRFSEDSGFVQGVMMGTQISNEQPGRYDVNFSTKPFEMTILFDDGVKRFALFEFLGNERMRVVTSQTKPKSWSDGDLMEFEFNPMTTP